MQSAFAQLIMIPPAPDSTCKSDTGIFTVGVEPNTSLEWQVSADSILGPWTVPTIGVSGVNSIVLMVTQPEMYDTHYFRVVVRDLNGVLPNDTSVSVLLTVFNDPTPTIISVPGGFAFCEGSSILLQTDSTYSMYSWGPLAATTPSITVMSGGMYTVTVTDINGCTGNSSSQVIQWSSPTPEILPLGPEVKFCPGKSLLLMCDSLVYSQYAWSNPPGGTGTTITVNSAGVYSLSVTDAHGCQASTSKEVGVFPPASPPTIDPPNKEFCKGDSLMLVGSSGYSSYAWNTGATGLSIFVSHEATYMLTVTDGNGCTAKMDAVVTENPIPKAGFSASIQDLDGGSVKAGIEIKFTDTSTFTGSPIMMWNWNFGVGGNVEDSLITTPNQYIEVYYSTEGTKMVCLEAIDQKVCKDKECIEFNVTPANGPDIELNILNTPRCIGDTFVIEALAYNGGALANDSLRQSITWNFDHTLIDSVNTELKSGSNSSIREWATFVFIKPGITDISGTARQFDKDTPTDFLEVSDSKTINSGSEVPKIIDSSIPSYLCEGQEVIVNLDISPDNDGKVVYSLNGMSATILPFSSGMASFPIVASTAPDIINVKIISIEVDGCVSEADTTYTIEVRAIPEVEITGLDTVCIGEVAWLVASGADTYKWKINDVQPPLSTNDSLKIKSDLPGLFNYTVVGMLNECGDRDSALVLVAEPPIPEIFGDSVVCKDQVVFYSSQDPLPDHMWTVTGGSAISQNQDSVLIQWQSVGQWPLVLTQNIGKCTGVRTETITVSDDNSPPFNSLVWLKGGRILVYPNPDLITGLCYQWYKDGVLLPGETYQGFVVPVGVSDIQLSTYSVKVWYCADGEDCAQLIVYRSSGSPPEETEPRFQIVPNPNSGTFFVEYEGLNPGHYVQHIISASGRMINEQELDIDSRSGSVPVSVSNLSAAVYFVRWVNTTSGAVLNTQIVVLP